MVLQQNGRAGVGDAFEHEGGNRGGGRRRGKAALASARPEGVLGLCRAYEGVEELQMLLMTALQSSFPPLHPTQAPIPPRDLLTSADAEDLSSRDGPLSTPSHPPMTADLG